MTINTKISLAAVIISAVSLINSFITCSGSKRVSEINAEVHWNTLLESYQRIDSEIRQWEDSKGMKRSGEIIKNRTELDLYLKKLESEYQPPDYILRLYHDRSDRYDSLSNIAKRYELVKDRLSNIDFNLPEPPTKSGFPYTFPFKLE